MIGTESALPAAVQDLVIITLPPSPIVLDPVPVVADWTFDEGTPDRPVAGIADQSGNRHDSVQLFGAPAFGTNACGGGSSLLLPQGAPFGFGSGFLVADSPDFDFTNEFTLEAVFEAGRDGFGFWRQVVGRDGGVGRPGLIPWSLGFNEATREVAFSVTGADLGSSAAVAPFPDDGARHHVAGVYSNLVLRLYVDGVLVATNQAPAPPATGPMAGVSIGANSIGGFWLAGVLDRVRITAQALDPRQFLDPCERWPDFRMVDAILGDSQGIPDGIGAAWGDYDKDGDPDLFLARGVSGADLLNNDGSGRFESVGQSTLGQVPGDPVAGAWADYDGDGDLDIAVAKRIFRGNDILRNDGTVFVSIRMPHEDFGRSTSGVLWTDANLDGLADAFFHNGGNVAGVDNELWYNRGNDQFERLPQEIISVMDARTQAAAWVDLDSDRFPDLVLANRGAPNAIFLNLGGTNFARLPGDEVWGGVTHAEDAVVAAGHALGDSHHDLVFGALDQRHKLAIGQGAARFVSGSVPTVDGSPAGVVWADFDNDGLSDLFFANRDGRNQFFRGDDVGGFKPLGLGGVTAERFTATACAVADVNQDGFLDILILQGVSQPSRLALNSGNSNGWLRVRASGLSAPDGRGVKVSVYPYGWGILYGGQHREIHAGDSSGSSEQVAHFGLGSVTNLDRVEITWPSGARLVLRDVSARQTLAVTEPDFGTPQPMQLDRQTGLLRQQIRFWQLQADATNAVRLRLRGVPDDVRVVGGERTGPGEWSYLFRGPMARLGGTEMTFEFYRASRAWFDGVTYEVAEVLTRPPDDVPAGAIGVTVDRVELLDGWQPLVEFAATPGARHLVQFADVLGEWRNASGTVAAGASRVQWVDTGAPKTAPRPKGYAGRFYRVFRLDATVP